MKQFIIFSAIMVLLLSSCSKEDIYIDKNKTTNISRANSEEPDSAFRLSFENEEELISLICPDNDKDIQPASLNPIASKLDPRFISLMDTKTDLNASIGSTTETFYEAYGYDSLVPNLNLAKLLNTKGELEIGNYVIKITPKGTFKFPIGCENEFDNLTIKNSQLNGTKIDEQTYQITKNIVLFKTFEENPDDYSLIYEGKYEELPDSYFGDDDETSNKGSRAGVPEPDHNSFKTFSADRQTFVGKIIQNIIGSTKACTVNISKKRRVRGSFYFYNYGFYGEIGVQGWTDKKNWIGWSKTRCDEIRVGWRHVLLKKSIPAYYSQVMKNVKDYAYMPPQMVEINGSIANAATLIMPDFPSTLKDQVIALGVNAVRDFIKEKFGNKATNFESANACIISTPKELYIIVNDGDIVRYNVKSYTHVFARNYMQFTIGWNNLSGFFLNNVNSSNASQINTWLNVIVDAVNQKNVTLTGGEVYVCARFGENWRGMRIIKK